MESIDHIPAVSFLQFVFGLCVHGLKEVLYVGIFLITSLALQFLHHFSEWVGRKIRELFRDRDKESKGSDRNSDEDDSKSSKP